MGRWLVGWVDRWMDGCVCGWEDISVDGQKESDVIESHFGPLAWLLDILKGSKHWEQTWKWMVFEKALLSQML